MTATKAVGIIEARGLVALTAGIEAMCKTADVQCVAIQKVGMGYLAAALEGSVAAVRQALEIGELAVREHGELKAARMYPKPDDASLNVLDNGSRKVFTGSAPALEHGSA
ncbi:BMC domain-containing protein [Gemmatimonas sp.]|uniref:BMC domain-containing protein n=1 Tax=Gemmatimonas sp. TaxID=1962908 RepID=UPI003566B331